MIVHLYIKAHRSHHRFQIVTDQADLTIRNDVAAFQLHTHHLLASEQPDTVHYHIRKKVLLTIRHLEPFKCIQ